METSHNLTTELEFTDQHFFYKYIDLSKFLYLVTKENLHFTRLDMFEDPFEGMTDDDIQLKHVWVNIPELEKINPEIPEEQRIKLPVNKKIVLKGVEDRTLKSQIGQFASCWYFNKNESMAMWNLYSKEQGVVLKINPSTLHSHVLSKALEIPDTSKFLHLTYGFCDYRQISPYNFMQSPSYNNYNAYKKDTSYEHEREFRYIAVLNEKFLDEQITGFQLPITEILSSFEIYAHPKMESWKVEVINELLLKLNVPMNIKESNIKLK